MIHLHCYIAYQEVDLFTEIRGSGANFDAVFGSTVEATHPAPQPATSMNQFGMGQILQPQAAGPLASQYPATSQTPRLTKDVDSSLANAAANLSMSKSTSSISSASSLTSPWQLSPNSPGATPQGVLYTDGGGHVPLRPVNVSPHPSPIDDIKVPGKLWGNLV